LKGRTHRRPRVRSLALLHTAASHAPRFSALLESLEEGRGVDVQHVVEETLLTDARNLGVDDVRVQRRLEQVLTSLAETSAVILCTCSTLGAAAEAFDKTFGARILRIDRPLARAAVAQGSTIVVVAALASTLEPTQALLKDEAARAGKPITLTTVVCEGVWDHFERGDKDAYLRAVAAHVDEVQAQGEVVVLAQASMLGAEAWVKTAKPVLSSPRLGLLAALELL